MFLMASHGRGIAHGFYYSTRVLVITSLFPSPRVSSLDGTAILGLVVPFPRQSSTRLSKYFSVVTFVSLRTCSIITDVSDSTVNLS